MDDSISVLLLCAGLVLLPVAAVFGVWIYKRRTAAMLAGYKKVISMDGAKFFQMNDNTLQIRPTKFINLIALIIVLIFDAVILFLTGTLVVRLLSGQAMADDTSEDLFFLVTVILLLGGTTVILLRSLRATPVAFDPAIQMLTSGSRNPQSTPFSAIRELRVGFDPTAVIDQDSMALIDLALALSNGETMRIGSLSGEAKQTQARALELARIVRDTINTGNHAKIMALTSDEQEIV